jgi:hypothetical protein
MDNNESGDEDFEDNYPFNATLEGLTKAERKGFHLCQLYAIKSEHDARAFRWANVNATTVYGELATWELVNVDQYDTFVEYDELLVGLEKGIELYRRAEPWAKWVIQSFTADEGDDNDNDDDAQSTYAKIKSLGYFLLEGDFPKGTINYLMKTDPLLHYAISVEAPRIFAEMHYK